MNAHDSDAIALAPAGTGAPSAPMTAPSAGALLRRGREAAGLSLDAVAQQLKLAPRQVTALEEDDFAHLPGRTFVRGFVRNYARLVRIDADAVIAALAGTDAAALDSPALQPTAPTIGELPTSEHAKPGWARWVIPLTLVAVIVTAGVYEFYRGRGDAPHIPTGAPRSSDGEAGRAAPAPAPAPGSAAGAAADTPLVNPMAPAASPASEPAAGTALRAAAEADAGSAPAAPGELTLVLTYRDSSWTEVRAAGGRVLVSQMIPAGQVRSVSGTPPFDLTIGNASDVSLEYRGKLIDLAPYTKKNVARVVLE